MTITFAKFDRTEMEQVDRIVSRAEPLFRRLRRPRERLDIMMDLAAVHAICPLRLAAFAESDDENFAHDIGGIAGHLNRETGELDDFFVPRFAIRGTDG